MTPPLHPRHTQYTNTPSTPIHPLTTHTHQVETLRDFGADNSESLAQLVWSFFEYWAWRHDYSADVISVRTGGFLRKEDKDWTRRIGNERHLVRALCGAQQGTSVGWVEGWSAYARARWV